MNIHVQDTYFVVGHFHYVMFGGTGFALFGAMHYWFPKMFGRMYHEDAGEDRLGPGHFIGFNTLYLPMFFLGWKGCRGATYDYLPEYQDCT